MAELTSKQKNSFSDTTFGVPELRKFPLNDKKHVIKAIQFFHHCPMKYKHELAHNINREAKIHGITITPSSVVYDYLNEMEQIEIDNLEDIYFLQDSLYLNETIGMSETQAKMCVDNAISLWKKRKNFIKNDTDKSKLVSDLRAEKAALNALQNRNDFNGILLRAKSTAKSTMQLLQKDNYLLSKFARGKGEYSGNNSINFKGKELGKKIGSTIGFAGAAIASGAAIGGVIANKKSDYNGDSNARRVAKTAGGTMAGLAAGAVIGGAGALANEYANRKKKMNAGDPEKPLRQHAERYVNFISNYQSDILTMQPGQENNQNNEEGED